MPPSHISTIMATRLAIPAVNATAIYYHAAGLARQVEGEVTTTASTATSSISGVIKPSSSQFIGGEASNAGQGVAIGVSCSIVAIFLVVMVIALSIHMDTGKGRYNLNARRNKARGPDTIQLRRPQQVHRQNQRPLNANREQNSTDAVIPGGLPVHYSPRQGSWKSTLDDKLARAIETARNWRT